MKRKSLVLTLVYALAVGGMIAVTAKDPEDGGGKKGGNSSHARIPIDGSNECQVDCCGSSGGQPEFNEQEGHVCHFNDEDPYHDMQVAMFESCADGCDP